MGTFIFVMIVTIIVCILLAMVILSQNPKGGGLSSTFGGGGGQMFGVQRTNDFLDKATWTLSIIVAVLVILSSFLVPKPDMINGVNPELPTMEQTAPVDANNAEAPATQPENQTPADIPAEQ